MQLCDKGGLLVSGPHIRPFLNSLFSYKNTLSSNSENIKQWNAPEPMFGLSRITDRAERGLAVRQALPVLPSSVNQWQSLPGWSTDLGALNFVGCLLFSLAENKQRQKPRDNRGTTGDTVRTQRYGKPIVITQYSAVFFYCPEYLFIH